MIRSHASASPSAPASTCPLAAHSVGLPSSPISRNRRGKRSVPKCLCTSGASAAKPPRSPPRENTFSCVEVSTTQRTASSSRAAVERGDQVVEQLVRERVAGLGLVERDRGDAVGDLVADGLVAASACPHPNAQRVDCALWPRPTSSSPTTPRRARHFIFTDEHEALRESIHAFVTKELAPHAEEWEETTFPDSVFPRMGELGLPRPLLSRGVRRPGRRLLLATSCSPRRSSHSDCGGLAMGIAVHTDMATPPILAVRHRGAEAELPRAGDQGREDLLPRHHRARRRLRRRRHPTRAVRDGDEWVINGSKTYITNGHRADFIVLVTQDRPRRRLRRLHAVPRRHGPARRDPREAAREARHARLRHGAARLPGRARAATSAVLGEVGKGFYHIMWELQGERLIGAAGCVAGAQRGVRPDAASTRRSARRSAARSATSR